MNAMSTIEVDFKVNCPLISNNLLILIAKYDGAGFVIEERRRRQGKNKRFDKKLR